MNPSHLEWTVTDAWEKENMMKGLWQVAWNNEHTMDKYCLRMVTAFCTEVTGGASRPGWGSQHQKKEFWKYIGLYVHPRKGKTIENTHLVISDLFCGLQSNHLYILKDPWQCFRAMQILADFNDHDATSDRWLHTLLTKFTPALNPEPPLVYNCWFNVPRTMLSNTDREAASQPASSSGDYQHALPASSAMPMEASSSMPMEATSGQQQQGTTSSSSMPMEASACPWRLAPQRRAAAPPPPPPPPAAAAATPSGGGGGASSSNGAATAASCSNRAPSSGSWVYVEAEPEAEPSSARPRASRRWGSRRDSDDEAPPPPPPGPPPTMEAPPPPLPSPKRRPRGSAGSVKRSRSA